MIHWALLVSLAILGSVQIAWIVGFWDGTVNEVKVARVLFIGALFGTTLSVLFRRRDAPD